MTKNKLKKFEKEIDKYVDHISHFGKVLTLDKLIIKIRWHSGIMFESVHLVTFEYCEIVCNLATNKIFTISPYDDNEIYTKLLLDDFNDYFIDGNTLNLYVSFGMGRLK